MPKRNQLGFVVLLSCVLAACSLAGDVTPPPGASVEANSMPLSPANNLAAPADSGLGYPAQPASVALGATIFAEHCAACHGPTGQGDGPAAAELLTQRTTPLPNFSAPEHFRAFSQTELFQIVTQGRLEKLMPPWANKLSEAERWSVVAYLYSLGISPAEHTVGQTQYAEHCAACHGAAGAGDGALVSGAQLPDFSQPTYSAPLTPQALFNVLVSHTPMEDFPTSLTATERWGLAYYLQTLAFDMGSAPPVAKMVNQTGKVTGRVVNGTLGTSLPPNLQITLRGFDNFAEAQTITSTLSPDGSFIFEAVPYQASRQFMLTTEFGGLTYSSDIFNFETQAQVSGLALTVYATTADPTPIQVERMHVTLDYGQNTSQIGVAEMWVLNNLGDKTFVPALNSGLEIPLPPGASSLAVQNLREGLDYARTANGFLLQTPLRPGVNSLQLSFSFNLPYAQPLAFAQPLPYAVNTLTIILPSAEFTVQGEGSLALADEGVQVRQATAFRSYRASNLAANTKAAFSVRSAPAVGDNVWLTYVLIGLLLLALGVLGWGIWWYRRTAPPPEREGLLQAIADLDDAFAAGQLERQADERERAHLKMQL